MKIFIHDAVLGESAHTLVPGHLAAPIVRALRAVLRVLNQIGTAIQLGEAGDLEGARAWREKTEDVSHGN